MLLIGGTNLALGDPTIARFLVFRARCCEHYYSSDFGLLFSGLARKLSRENIAAIIR
jgi:hypothetical protein